MTGHVTRGNSRTFMIQTLVEIEEQRSVAPQPLAMGMAMARRSGPVMISKQVFAPVAMKITPHRVNVSHFNSDHWREQNGRPLDCLC
jgi:hypothetical protein